VSLVGHVKEKGFCLLLKGRGTAFNAEYEVRVEKGTKLRPGLGFKLREERKTCIPRR